MRRTPEASGDPLRAVSPAVFAVIVIVFFLPFVTCNGVKVSGVQAATGFTPPGSDPAAKTISSDAQAPNPLVLIGLVSAVAGIVVMGMKGRAGPFGSALAGLIGALSLGGFALQAGAQAHGQLEIEFGLPLAVSLFLGAVLLNDLLLARLPLLRGGDNEGLARRMSIDGGWLAACGIVIPALLFLGAAMTVDGPDVSPFLIALVPVAVVWLVALVISIGRYDRAGSLTPPAGSRSA